MSNKHKTAAITTEKERRKVCANPKQQQNVSAQYDTLTPGWARRVRNRLHDGSRALTKGMK